jgi:AraC family transcriptional regulator
MHQVDVVEEAARRVIGLEHRGAYSAIGPTFHRLMQMVGERGLQGEMREFLGVYFDDPRVVPEDKLRSMAAIRVRDELPVPEGFADAMLPGGRYARARVRGSYAQLPAAYQWLYGTWLPGSDERQREAPSFEVYVSDPSSVPEPELLTEIYVPLA